MGFRRRWDRWQWAIAASVLVASGVGAGLAWSAWRAQALHRQAVLAHLDNLAAVALDRFVSGLEVSFRQSISPLFPSLGEPNDLPELLVGMSEARRALQADRCQCIADFRPETFFRLPIPAGPSESIDSLARPARLDPSLEASVRRFVDTTSDPGYRFAIFLETAGDRGVVVSTPYLEGTTQRALYGFTFDRAHLAAEVIGSLFRRLSLVPRFLPPSIGNAEYLSLSVASSDGRTFFRTEPQYPAAHHDSIVLAPRRAGLLIRTAINPALTKLLVPGGVPARVPYKAFGLIALALACWIAIAGFSLRAVELARLRTDFAASVTHELRTPVTQIRLAAETLLLGRATTPTLQRATLASVVDETRRLEQLIDNVLHFSRAERRLIEVRPTPQPLEPIIRLAATGFEPIAAQTDSSIRVEIEPGLTAMVDADAVRQVLLNLLDNAVRHGPRGQVVRVRAGTVGGSAEIVVSDQGPGIPRAERDRVWRPFVRLNDHGNGATGTGLGLAVVRDLLGALGGTAAIESNSEGGTTVRVMLPEGTSAGAAR